MPKLVKGNPEEREKFMQEVFRTFYTDPANAGKDLSVAKANEAFKKQYGSMLRNKKTYQIRRAVLAEINHKGGTVAKAARTAQQLTVAPGAAEAACLINGSAEQLAWLKNQVLPKLQGSGLAQAKVDHETPAYLVVARS